jgi:general secretion pathway protein D
LRHRLTAPTFAPITGGAGNHHGDELKIPTNIIDQLPTIGNVVGNTGHSITRTELIIFIRPRIIRDSVDAHYVAEELRTKLKGALAPVPPYVGPAPRAH